ncbi:MAG: hypothetical protein ACK4NP_08860 [Parvularculaceae bacterium]
MESNGVMSLNGAAAARVCVLVLGMHRSGTSALARTLSLLGCDLPKTLLGAAPGNELGHWESAPVCRVNDDLLESAGSSWHDFEAVNPDWFRSPKAGEYRERAIATLKDEFGGSWLYALKDPRINRLAGWWAETIESAGARPAILTTLRHPLEVAASLKKRDNFDMARGVLLWLRNTLDAEAQTRGRQRAFISYDALLSNWKGTLDRAAKTLDLSWPKRQSAAAPAIDEFLSDKERHHRRDSDAINDGAHAWASEAFAILSRWAEAGEDAQDYPALDRIRSRLDEAGHAFARLVALQHFHQGQAAKLENALAAAEKRSAELEVKRADDEKRLSLAAAEIADLKSRLAMTESALKQRSVEAEDQARAVADLAARLKDAEAAATKLAELEAALADTKRELEAARQAAEQAAARHKADLASAKAASEAEASARFKEIAEMTRMLKAREAALSRAQADYATLDALFATRSGETDELRRSLKEADAGRHALELDSALRAAAAARAIAEAPLAPVFKGRQLRARVMMLMKAGLFDADWYRAHNKDVAAAGVDPARHFVEFGAREGRAPSAAVEEAMRRATAGAH